MQRLPSILPDPRVSTFPTESHPLKEALAKRLGLPDGQGTSALGRRLATITLLRLVFLSLLLVIFGRLHLHETHLRTFSVQTAIIAIAVAFSLAAVYALILKLGRYYPVLVYAQLVLDQATWTVLVYLSGGATSGASSLYGLTAMTGAILGGLPAATIASLVGFVFYLIMCALMVTGLLPTPPDQLDVHYANSLAEVASPVAINLLVLIVVTLLAGYLSERLRLAGGQLREATARAVRAERFAYLGKVSAGLAHEIRNPLGSIQASIELIREAPSLSDEERRLCDIIYREASRLNDLVTDMVDLARPQKPNVVQTNITQTTRDVVTLAEGIGRGAEDVRIRYEGPSQPHFVQADPGKLRQLLWNLVRNAVQATAPGSEVVVQVHALPKETILSVKDEGPGLSESALAHMFDAFFTTRSHGSGIGLAVVKRIIDDHGWTVAVNSDPAKGTTFSVQILNP